LNVVTWLKQRRSNVLYRLVEWHYVS